MAKVEIQGLPEWARDLQRGASMLGTMARSNLEKAGRIVVGAANDQFRGSRTRALYEISGGKRKKRKHPWPVTSPPHRLGIFEGHYTRAISFSVGGAGRQMYAEVGPVGIPYAPVHEFGLTVRGHRMPVRQVMTPAVMLTQKRVFDLIGTSFKVLR